MIGEHTAAMALKACTVLAGIAWFGWHAVSVLAQAVPDAETAGNLFVTAGSTGAIVGVLYWAINRIDRLIKDVVKDREDDERRREDRWMAHDAKRDETLRTMQESCHAQHRSVIETVNRVAEKNVAALDRNSEALVRNDSTLRRCEDRDASGSSPRKTTG